MQVGAVAKRLPADGLRLGQETVVCPLLFLAGGVFLVNLQVRHRASTGEFEPLLDLLLQRCLDGIVPDEIHLGVRIQFEGLVHPPEVAVMVGVEQVLSFIKQQRLVLIEPQASTEVISELLDSLLDLSRLDVAGISPVLTDHPLAAVFDRLARDAGGDA